MPSDEHPLDKPLDPRDAEGRTPAEAIAAKLAEDGEELRNWLDAKDEHTGFASSQGTHNQTAKAEPTGKVRPDTTKAGLFRGKVAPQERIAPKAGAVIHPRRKFRPNDPSKTGASRG